MFQGFEFQIRLLSEVLELHEVLLGLDSANQREECGSEKSAPVRILLKIEGENSVQY